jgi:polyhydroxyalkanoate synthesis regulator protein
MKKIDVLSEDQPIPSQKYALISIVGPNMNQKCSVYGLKVRGVCDSLESAKVLTKKLMKFDKDYDIYTVDVGKFVPLAVEPYDVSNVEYENEQLNALVKNYLENKEKANEHWQERKQEMMKDAIREGQLEGQKELANKKEHPVAVLQRMTGFEEKMKQLQEQMDDLSNDLNLTKEKYNSYSEEERMLADKELKNAIENVTEELSSVKVRDSEPTIEEIRNEIMNEVNSEGNDEVAVEDVLKRLTSLDLEIAEMTTTLNLVDAVSAPSVHSRLSKNLSELLESKRLLKEQLNNVDSINNYINSNYKDSKHDNLFN